MKTKRNILIGFILGILISLIFLIFKSSIILKYASFILGFIACLTLGAIFSIFLIPSNQKKHFTLNRIAVSVFIILAGLVSSFLILRQNEFSKTQTTFEEKRVEQQSELIKSIKQGNLVFLMSELLDKVDKESKANSGGQLSNETIDRIAALSYSFEPYKYYEGDSLAENNLSPERGQLLLALSKMKIDSTSFRKIILKTSFAGADLKGANFKEADLSQVDLSAADLRESDLSGANLKGANLKGSNLWGANLRNANMKGTTLNRADLGWTDLTNTLLRDAVLNGVNLTAAKLSESDLTNAQIKWANLTDVFLKESNLTNANLYGTILKRANLVNVNLTKAEMVYVDLREAVINEANFSEVRLIKAGVKEANWIEELYDWNVTGAEGIQEKYEVLPDHSKRTPYHLITISKK